jgi:hypothetical protein
MVPPGAPPCPPPMLGEAPGLLGFHVYVAVFGGRSGSFMSAIPACPHPPPYVISCTVYQKSADSPEKVAPEVNGSREVDNSWVVPYDAAQDIHTQCGAGLSPLVCLALSGRSTCEWTTGSGGRVSSASNE